MKRGKGGCDDEVLFGVAFSFRRHQGPSSVRLDANSLHSNDSQSVCAFIMAQQGQHQASQPSYPHSTSPMGVFPPSVSVVPSWDSNSLLTHNMHQLQAQQQALSAQQAQAQQTMQYHDATAAAQAAQLSQLSAQAQQGAPWQYMQSAYTQQVADPAHLATMGSQAMAMQTQQQLVAQQQAAMGMATYQQQMNLSMGMPGTHRLHDRCRNMTTDKSSEWVVCNFVIKRKIFCIRMKKNIHKKTEDRHLLQKRG